MNRVFKREKFKRYLTDVEREEFLQALIGRATLIDVTASIQVCRDPNDNQILELAFSGQATFIISGDRDLLILNPFEGIAILTVDQFLETIQPLAP